MIFSGNNFLSLNHQTGLSFSIDLNFNSISGLCELGFSGSNPNSIPKEKISYTFDKSKIYDPENRYVYFYKENESLNLSGSIGSNSYSYYINGNPLCSNGNKNLFNINRFYLNTSGCVVDANLKVLGDMPNYNINFNKFNVSGILTGVINNNSASQFKIYSGTITAPTGFNVNTSNLDVLTGVLPSYITINTFNATKNQTIDDTKYSINLNLYTNFGLITKSYDVTGSFLKDIQIILNLGQAFDFDLINSITGISQIKNQEYTLNFNIQSGTGILPKNLNFKLEYLGGETGTFYQDILATGYKNHTLTGIVTGSAIIRNTTSLVATGYDFLYNIEKTGLISGVIENLVFATGLNINTGYLLTTGFYNQNPIYRNIIYNDSGFSENGFVIYNKYYNDSYFYDGALLTGSNTQNNYLFGHNIAHNSNHNILAISAPSGNINTYTGVGLVYIFTGINNNWSQAAIISGNDSMPYDNFGYSLSMNYSGNILAIGAPKKNLGTLNQAGSVYIFTGSGSNWLQQTRLTGSDCATGDGFGYALELSKDGTTLVIGAPNKNIGTGINISSGAGLSYVFYNQSNIWNEVARISGNDTKTGDGFGSSVGINKNGFVLGIGSTGSDINTFSNVGSVYLFSGDPFISSWKQNVKLTGSNSSSGDNLGYMVKVSSDGNTILTSSINNSTGAGHVYIFTGDMFNKFNYRQQQRLQASDLISGDNFGYSISLNDDASVIAISSPSDSYSTLNNAGAIYIFTGTNYTWIEKQKITGNPNFIQSNNKLGNYLCLNSGGDNLFAASELFNTGSYNNMGIVFNFRNVNFTGFIGQISGTGIVESNSDYLATGLVTGVPYVKTFFDVFDLQTGYYFNNQLTGIRSFKTGNFILNQSYVNSAIIDNNINLLYLSVESKNHPDFNAITGNLIISGYDQTNYYYSVITNNITGKR